MFGFGTWLANTNCGIWMNICSSNCQKLHEFCLQKVGVPTSSAIIPSRPSHPFQGTEMSRPKWWRPKFIRLILLQVGQIPLDFRVVWKAQVAFILLCFITHGGPTHPTNYHVNQQKWPSQLELPFLFDGKLWERPRMLKEASSSLKHWVLIRKGLVLGGRLRLRFKWWRKVSLANMPLREQRCDKQKGL